MSLLSSQAGDQDQPIEEAANVQGDAAPEESTQDGQQPEDENSRDIEKKIAEMEERLARSFQSQVAKLETRMSARIQERLASLDASREVLNLSDEQYAAAQDRIIAEEQRNEFVKKQPGRDGTQANTVQPEQEFAAFVADQVEGVFTNNGFRVTPDMPEYQQIEAAYNDPNGNLSKLLIAAHDASLKAKTRLESLKGNAKARTTSSGNSTGPKTTQPKTAEEKIAAGIKRTNWNQPAPR